MEAINNNTQQPTLARGWSIDTLKAELQKQNGKLESAIYDAIAALGKVQTIAEKMQRRIDDADPESDHETLNDAYWLLDEIKNANTGNVCNVCEAEELANGLAETLEELNC